jgi:hypothetical protein
VLFVRIANFHQPIAIQAAAVNVEQQRAQRIAAKRDTPFLVSLAMYDNRPPVAVEVRLL